MHYDQPILWLLIRLNFHYMPNPESKATEKKCLGAIDCGNWNEKEATITQQQKGQKHGHDHEKVNYQKSLLDFRYAGLFSLQDLIGALIELNEVLRIFDLDIDLVCLIAL